MDNPNPAYEPTNLDPEPQEDPNISPAPDPIDPAPAPSGGSWKDQLGPDLKNAPFMQKFDDSPEGMKKAFESYGNLEKLLGHEKVPIPKDINDVEGWNRFSKAMGIPDKAEGYGLPDAVIPESMKGLEFNKQEFAEIAHAHKMTPAQAKGIWESFTQKTMQQYADFQKSQQEQLVNTVNQLKREWGDAYDANVEVGQMVINKFSDSEEMNDFITATLSKDPRGVKFLAKIGDQFAENKVGEFGIKRFSLAPEQAKEEWHKITKDPKHPYNNPDSSPRERQEAIDYVNRLIAITNKG